MYDPPISRKVENAKSLKINRTRSMHGFWDLCFGVHLPPDQRSDGSHAVAYLRMIPAPIIRSVGTLHIISMRSRRDIPKSDTALNKRTLGHVDCIIHWRIRHRGIIKPVQRSLTCAPVGASIFIHLLWGRPHKHAEWGRQLPYLALHLLWSFLKKRVRVLGILRGLSSLNRKLQTPQMGRR